MCVCERERAHTHAGAGGGADEETESLLNREPHAGSIPGPRDYDLSLMYPLNCLSHPGTPFASLKKSVFFRERASVPVYAREGRGEEERESQVIPC